MKKLNLGDVFSKICVYVCMNRSLIYIMMSSCLLSLFSCSDYFTEQGTVTQGGGRNMKANSWMHAVMGEWYLWNDGVGALPGYVASTDYQTFLSDLLSGMSANSDDGGYRNGKRYFYSYVERTASTRSEPAADPTFGLGMIFVETDSRGGHLLGRVTYVHDGSPASKAGIKRGMWFYRVDGEDITHSNYTRIVEPSAGGQITLSQAAVSFRSGVCDISPAGRNYKLVPVREPMSPVLEDTVFQIGGRRIGYLAYLRFERGSVRGSTEYERQLEDVFAAFRADGIDDLILDLRYNPGGYTVTCRLLASLIVRADKLGTVYARSRFNASHGESTELFDTEVADKNVNMSRLYVLATDRTASASENIINSLRGAGVEVIHIGTRTEGKNVGMTLFEKNGLDGYDYDFWPVTFRIYNARSESDFGGGFVPQIELDEWAYEYIEDWRPLGQSDELLTRAAIDAISGGSTAESAGTRTSDRPFAVVAATEDFCRTGGMRRTEPE